MEPSMEPQLGEGVLPSALFWAVVVVALVLLVY